MQQIILILVLFLIPIFGADTLTTKTRTEQPPQKAAEQLEVPPPPFTEGLFPCMDCHEFIPVNRKRRKLTDMHTDIVLRHDEKHRWCLDCHDATNRNFLHLASGELVSFKESYKLCGQCHGEKYRDWRAGVHGRRTGYWNGEKRYLLCVHCHNPHQPRFRAIKPMPAPVPPDEIRKSAHGEEPDGK